jgi:hypothetical protein
MAAFPVPYTVVLVEAEDAPGVRFVGSIPGRDTGYYAGMPMEVVFEDMGDASLLPQWRPSSVSGS